MQFGEFDTIMIGFLVNCRSYTMDGMSCFTLLTLHPSTCVTSWSKKVKTGEPYPFPSILLRGYGPSSTLMITALLVFGFHFPTLLGVAVYAHEEHIPLVSIPSKRDDDVPRGVHS